MPLALAITLHKEEAFSQLGLNYPKCFGVCYAKHGSQLETPNNKSIVLSICFFHLQKRGKILRMFQLNNGKTQGTQISTQLTFGERLCQKH
jgi:hypothetical protein